MLRDYNGFRPAEDPGAVCSSGSTYRAVFPEDCSVSVEMKVSVNGKSELVNSGNFLNTLTGDHPQQRLAMLVALNLHSDGRARDTGGLSA